MCNKNVDIKISEHDKLVVPIRSSLIEVTANKEATEPMFPIGYVELVTSKA